MKLWNRIAALFKVKPGERREFHLDVDSERGLRLLAAQDQRRPEEVAASLIHAALDARRQETICWQHWHTLTHREKEVAALICLNYTGRQIGGRLHIAPDTVKTHVRNILTKFGVARRDDLRQMLASWDFSAWG